MRGAMAARVRATVTRPWARPLLLAWRGSVATALHVVATLAPWPVHSGEPACAERLRGACAGSPLPKEGAVHCAFTDFSFKLEVTINGTVHKLDVTQLLHRVVPAQCATKVLTKSKKVKVELAKADKGKKWKKLSSI